MNHLEGKQVFLRPTGNAARGNKEKIYPATISKVSRVFVHILHENSNNEKKLRMGLGNNLNDDHNGGYVVYETHQAALDSIEIERLAKEIISKITYSSLAQLSLENIRKIDEALK